MILSLQKVLGLLATIWLVWKAFRFFEALQKKRSNHATNNGESKSAGETGTRDDKAYETPVDLRECDLCGAWFSGETCERENCPD